jgi:hypothetical protein
MVLARYLYAEDVLTGVAFEQGPLRLHTLEQTGTRGHLAAGDVRTQALAYSSERQVTHLKQIMGLELTLVVRDGKIPTAANTSIVF